MDAADVEDFFAPFAPVRARRMFSGYGVYFGDACFALCVGGDFLIRVDDEAERAALQAAGSRSFAYSRSDGKVIAVSAFWTLPDAALDDEDALKRWCGPALAAARRSAAQKAAAAARRAAKAGDEARAKTPPRRNKAKPRLAARE